MLNNDDSIFEHLHEYDFELKHNEVMRSISVDNKCAACSRWYAIPTSELAKEVNRILLNELRLSRHFRFAYTSSNCLSIALSKFGCSMNDSTNEAVSVKHIITHSRIRPTARI